MNLSRTQIKQLLADHDLAPSRALGQNFLCDAGMIDKIVRLAKVTPGDSVIEIGPGLGSLTLGLCKAGAAVTAIEIDRYIIPVLRKVVTEAGYECTILNEDATKFDWSGLLGDKSWKVVANLPYNIATPLILDLLREQRALQEWVVMVQREAGERLVATPGSRIYGIPSVLAAYWGQGRIVGSVRPELFLPQPKVDSVLVEIIRHETPMVQAPFAAFSQLVKTAFGKRRKMLRGSLNQHLTIEEIESADIAPTARPEEIDLQGWGRLAEVFAASATS